jgi:membrane protease YdiL (CAAX protease family)
MGSDEQQQAESLSSTGRSGSGGETARRQVATVAVVVALFAFAFALSVAVTRLVGATVGLGEPGTLSRLVTGIAGLQVLGFGIGTVVVLRRRAESWQSYLRVEEFTQWTAAYGAFVGMVLMFLTVAATLLFRVLEIEPAESAGATVTDPGFYVVLFVLSTLVAVPMEEVFFRGILQRRLEETVHPGVAVLVASLLFTLVHASVNVGSGGELLAFGLFFAFGLALGTSYHLTGNLLVPLTGHVIYNGVQILVQIARLVS